MLREDRGSGEGLPEAGGEQEADLVLAALEECAPFFIRFGGHKQAAGLTMDAARVRELVIERASVG